MELWKEVLLTFSFKIFSLVSFLTDLTFFSLSWQLSKWILACCPSVSMNHYAADKGVGTKRTSPCPTCNKIELTNFVCSGTSHFLGKAFTGLVTYTYFAREFLPKTYLEIFFSKKQNRKYNSNNKGQKKYQIMNLMVPSAWNKDYFIFFLSTFHPDSLGKWHGQINRNVNLCRSIIR